MFVLQYAPEAFSKPEEDNRCCDSGRNASSINEASRWGGALVFIRTKKVREAY